MAAWRLTGMALAALVALTVGAPRAMAEPTEAGFRAWVEGFRAEARAAGFDAALIERAFAPVELEPKVLELDRKQPEFATPVWVYLDRLVSEKRIAAGAVAIARVKGELEAIEARYGVPASVVAAIWGVESNFGENRGAFDIIEAMATLAYDGRRRDFWKAQLLAALRIMAAGEAGEGRLMGSWAGAMGHTQFIPESFERLAVDFDGDGRRDIWSDDPGDALASTANYLAASGWRRGEPWGLQVRLPAEFDFALLDGAPRSTDEWSAVGLVQSSGGALPSGVAGAELILPAGARGPAFLVLENFRAILKYNGATSYALAVSLLAERLEGRPPRAFGWPEDEKPLTLDQSKELQEALIQLGFDLGKPDGILGPKTRGALRAFQRANSMVADGYPSLRLLEDVRRALAVRNAPIRLVEDAGPATAADIREMQALLTALGFEIGKIDGEPGARTLRAMKRFVEQAKLEIEAEPSKPMLDALRAAVRGG